MPKHPLNLAAAELLRQEKQPVDPQKPAVLQLARWGMENRAPLTSAGERSRDALESSLDLLLNEETPVVMWHFRDHDPAVEKDPEALLEREQALAEELSQRGPLSGAAMLLDRLTDSLTLRNPSLAP